MRTAIITYQPDATPDYPYNVYILFNNYYCGIGRFCETLDKALEYARREVGRENVSVRRKGPCEE